MPPLGMLYIPLDVRFGRDPKIRALVVRHGMEGFAAASLYLLMAAYCRENLTDGFVPAEEVGALAYPLPEETWRRLAGYLSEPLEDPAGEPLSPSLTEPLSGGFRVCAYVRRNGTRKEALERAQKNAESGRLGGLAKHRGGAHRRRPARQSSEPPSDPASGPPSETPLSGEPPSQTETESYTRARKGFETRNGRNARDAPPRAGDARARDNPDYEPPF